MCGDTPAGTCVSVPMYGCDPVCPCVCAGGKAENGHGNCVGMQEFVWRWGGGGGGGESTVQYHTGLWTGIFACAPGCMHASCTKGPLHVGDCVPSNGLSEAQLIVTGGSKSNERSRSH